MIIAKILTLSLNLPLFPKITQTYMHVQLLLFLQKKKKKLNQSRIK